MINKLSKHPYDWILHCLLCFIPVYAGWANPLATIFVAILIEFEQKKQVWNYDLTWGEYFLKKAMGDLIADGLGILLAAQLSGVFQ